VLLIVLLALFLNSYVVVVELEKRRVGSDLDIDQVPVRNLD
jgi:hypothetical protein